MVRKRRKFHGIAVSPGIAWGKACAFGDVLTIPRKKIRVNQIPREMSRFFSAIAQAKTQLSDLRNRVAQDIGDKEAEIFDAHYLFLEDPVFLAQVQNKLFEEQINVEAAIVDVIRDSIRMFASIKDSYLRERIQDIRDVGRRVLENLVGYQRQCFLQEQEKIIVVAEELTPSQTVNLDQNRVKGFVTEKGGITSHAAILARSLGIPLVSGVKGIVKQLELGMPVLIDGFRGEVIVNPVSGEIRSYKERIKDLKFKADEERKLTEFPATTEDGYTITLLANIRSEADVEFAQHFRADGIGLYRTEIHFIDQGDFPSEEEQFEHYRRVAEMMNPHCVTIRTLDLGGDKFSAYVPRSREGNPYLGLRAIRISLENPDMFKAQLRAILRASAFGHVKLLLPMISSIEEVRQARKYLKIAMDELEAENIPFDKDLQVGVMIEVPSAAIAVGLILQEVDFISVGTNDLIQYTLAVDRSNERVSQLYEPLHPAIIQLLKSLADAARAAHKEISICGEMAGDTRYTELLLGLGYRELSMSSFFIPQVKRVIRNTSMESAQKIAQKVLTLGEIDKIRRVIIGRGKKRNK